MRHKSKRGSHWWWCSYCLSTCGQSVNTFQYIFVIWAHSGTSSLTNTKNNPIIRVWKSIRKQTISVFTWQTSFGLHPNHENDVSRYFISKGSKKTKTKHVFTLQLLTIIKHIAEVIICSELKHFGSYLVIASCIYVVVRELPVLVLASIVLKDQYLFCMSTILTSNE